MVNSNSDSLFSAYSIPALLLTCIVVSGCVSHEIYRGGEDSIFPVETKIDGQVAAMAVVEFDDQGFFWDGGDQLVRATELIKNTRNAHDGQEVVVILFIHGWNHNAQSEHFDEFQNTIKRLALRENQLRKRPVIGVYFGWRGLRSRWFPFKQLSYWNRNATATRIGNGPALPDAIQEIVEATKSDQDSIRQNGQKSRVILVGHSMGALIMQKAFFSMLPGITAGATHDRPIDLGNGPQGRVFADLVILVNSAADSLVATGLIDHLKRYRVRKTVNFGEQPYQAPLFISVTSKKDYATRGYFKIGRFFEPYRGAREHKSEPFEHNQRKYWYTTEGHNEKLQTHKLEEIEEMSACEPYDRTRKYTRDIGQGWHCFRDLEFEDGQIKSVKIALPTRDRKQGDMHRWYQFSRNPVQLHQTPFWIVQVPGEIIDSHNDIFNEQARLFLLALVEISAAVMSEQADFEQVFPSSVYKR